MDRRDVTPKMKKRKSNGIWRKLGLGVVGGVIGGLLTFGIFYAATGGGNSVTTSSSSGTQNASGETVVENVKKSM